MKLNEIYGEKIELVESEKKDTTIITGTFAKGDVVNRNKRLYPSDILEKAIERVQGLIESGETPYGMSGHPENVEGIISNVSHVIRQIWWNKQEKEGNVNIEVLPTTSGKEISTIIRHKGALYFSLRGLGTTTKAESHEVVNPDFQLAGVDIVLQGGFAEGKLTQKNIVGESWTLNPQEQKTVIEENKLLKRFAYAKNAGYKKDLATYRREVEGTESATDKEMASFRNAKMSGYKGNLADYLSMIRD